MEEYGRVLLGDHETLDRVDVIDPGCNAESAFSSLSLSGRTFEVSAGDIYFTGRHEKRYLEPEQPGDSAVDTRICGVQRKGTHLVLSGGDELEGTAHLMIASLEFDAKQCPTGGRLERIYAVDNGRTRAGGIQRIGNLLAVPLDGEQADARVIFFEISNPLAPNRIRGADVLRGREVTRAVAITLLPDGRLLLGALSEQKRFLGLFGARPIIDVYLSRTDDISDGFGDPLTVELPESGGGYGSIAFLGPVGDHQTVRLFLLGVRGADMAADLLEMRVILSARQEKWARAGSVSLVSTPQAKQFQCVDRHTRFAAGGIDIDHGKISVYTAYPWRVDNRFCFSVFRP